MVARLEVFKRLALVSLDNIGDKLLGVDVKHPGRRVVAHQLVADGVHQVRFAQADAAVDEQRVVKLAQAVSHMQRGGASHAVGRAFDQGVKGQRRVEPVFKNGLGRVFGRIDSQRLGCADGFEFSGKHVGLDGCLTRCQRQLDGNRLARDFFQQGRDAGCVLGAHPVKFEAVAHLHRRFGQVGRNADHQRAYPGVELLLGQFLSQMVNTGLPQLMAQATTHERLAHDRFGAECCCEAAPSRLWILLILGTRNCSRGAKLSTTRQPPRRPGVCLRRCGEGTGYNLNRVKSAFKEGKNPKFPAKTSLGKSGYSTPSRLKRAVDNPVDNFGITYELSTGKGQIEKLFIFHPPLVQRFYTGLSTGQVIDF